jgi:thiol-disulfide isomerase/thioredoxin
MTRRAILGALLATPLAAPATSAAAAAAPASGLAPLGLASGWLNGRVTAAELRGRVVLLDVFTFECINCVHVTPNLKRLYDAYGRPDLEIVAVHTPEVPSYQSRVKYLAEQTRAAALPWPIAIDNRSAIWDAYGVSAWPTQLLFDRHGRLRHTIVGEGQDDEVNAAVRLLVKER